MSTVSKIKDSPDFQWYIIMFFGISVSAVLLGGAAFQALSLFSK